MPEPASRAFIGTSGWAYPSWKPDFYPQRIAPRDFLSSYATRLNAVEVNYTFRQILEPSTIANWLSQTPSEFRFVVKAHQSITHFRRLRNVEEPLQRFLDSIQPLFKSRRLGPVLYQLPHNMKADPVLLDEFLAQLPSRPRRAVEFRHDSWLSEEVFRVLRRRKTALCISETEKITTPEVQTADFVYYRFRHPDYTKRQRTVLRKRIERFLSEGVPVYAFFMHEDEPSGPLWAEELFRALQR